MKNVGMKTESYRIATASSELFAPPNSLQLLAEAKTEKGD
ncbi:MAG: bifunctional molybdenum cofactor biosynthesis protein MoaC/MoaB, partial [Acinetobacter sp.]|nr:bifunctional molybdenum cofactor biosynthesis protein MoaC/MoaB [Acinetobacter sp.]